ncbi:hypothetical protein SDC9_109848 [bioreactor metagenome]|uniref:HTH cro/C1-type domain-containing protein n=1 Tax=bioreactor metagenome TaxID=1076179 RepID=A0A645BBY0_9ZZZZ
MFYENFINLCEIRGVSPTKVLLALGISKGSLGRWKTGGKPLNEAKKKIADYFGISVAELMGANAEKPAANTGGELSSEKKEIIERLNRLEKSNPSLYQIALRQLDVLLDSAEK